MTAATAAPLTRKKRVPGAWAPVRNLASLFEYQQDTFGLINGLRFFSFVWILIFHTYFAYGIVAGKDSLFTLSEQTPVVMWWIFNADKAVDLFFVLSGFLISLILFKELGRSGTIQLRRFYFRRYLRLTPIYAVLLLLYWVAGGKNREYIWTNLLYVNNFLSMDDVIAMQWTWTLAVEEQFYLLLPLILIGIARLPGKPFVKVLGGLLLLSFLIRLAAFYFLPDMWSSDYRALLTDKAICPTYYVHIYDNLITRFGPFICGTLAAYAYCYHQETITAWLRASNGRRLALNGGAFALILFFMFLPVTNQVLAAGSWELRTYLVVNRSLFAGGVAWFMLMVFLQLHHGHWLARLLSLRLWQPFSQLTYSMYLVHMLVILAVMLPTYRYFQAQASMEADLKVYCTLATTAVLSLLVSLIVGVLSWVLVEKPFLNLRDRAKTSHGSTSAAPMRHSIS